MAQTSYDVAIKMLPPWWLIVLTVAVAVIVILVAYLR